MTDSPSPLSGQSSVTPPSPSPVGEEGGNLATTHTITDIYAKVKLGNTPENAKKSTIIQLKDRQALKLQELRNEYNRTGYHFSNALGLVDWVKHMWNTWKVERHYNCMIQSVKNTKLEASSSSIQEAVTPQEASQRRVSTAWARPRSSSASSDTSSSERPLVSGGNGTYIPDDPNTTPPPPVEPEEPGRRDF